MKPSKWLRWLPYFYLWVDIGILEVQTSIIHRNNNCQEIEWLRLLVKVFHKWGFEFELYSPHRRKWEK